MNGYSYDPTKIGEYGLDRMRFELGDIVNEHDDSPPYIADAEIMAILATGCRWTHAKVLCLESICRAFAYQVDTKVGPLALDYDERAERFRKMLEEAKAEDISISPSVAGSARCGRNKPPYFYTDMMHNRRSDA